MQWLHALAIDARLHQNPLACFHDLGGAVDRPEGSLRRAVIAVRRLGIPLIT